MILIIGVMMEELLKLNDEVEKYYEKISQEEMEKKVDSTIGNEYNIALDILLASFRTVQKLVEKLEFILENNKYNQEKVDFLSFFSKEQIASLKDL